MPNASFQIRSPDVGHKATWFELCFDLVFIVAVTAVAGALSHHEG